MSISYALNFASTATQRGNEQCFVGGAPRLPEGVAWPTCALCRAPLTFFFQLAFPNDHAWAGRSLALFSCTSCAEDDHLIPEMLQSKLAGADIPAGFLDRYQTNFRILVFDTERAGVPNLTSEPVLAFRPIMLAKAAGSKATRLGGAPLWLLEDESPARYGAEHPMDFLFQLSEGLTFEMANGARPQIEIGLSGLPQPSPEPFYRLFISNRIFAFGARDASNSVYVITQI